MYILTIQELDLKKRNLPTIKRASILGNQEVKMMDIKAGTIPQYVNIFLIVFGVLGAGGWYMGGLDNSVKKIDTKIDRIVEMHKSSNTRFETLASSLVQNQIKIATSNAQISQLEKKTDRLEQRQYTKRSKKRRR